VAQLVDLKHRLQLHIPHPAHALNGVVEMLAGKIIFINISLNGTLIDLKTPIWNRIIQNIIDTNFKLQFSISI